MVLECMGQTMLLLLIVASARAQKTLVRQYKKKEPEDTFLVDVGDNMIFGSLKIKVQYAAEMALAFGHLIFQE